MRKRFCFAKGKRIYATREFADTVRIDQEKKQAAIRLRIYVCEFCQGWHLTHQKQNRW